jgi:ABC-type Mn2+/Zn2+ transport system ATPase subunit
VESQSDSACTVEEPIVALERVSVLFGDRIILEEITLETRRGEFVGIIGPNGSGKTTLIRTILGQIPASYGTVRLFGKPVEELGAERHRIGYVPQGVHVDLGFPIRVSDVVLMGRYGPLGLMRRPGKDDRAATHRAMERVGILELAQRPLGELSGGQRQRVYVARALAVEPELLILDEPTTGIDVAATEGFYEFLQRLQQETRITLILVSHDIGVVSSYVDQIACLNRVLVAHGKPQECLTEEAMETMYGTEARMFHHQLPPHVVVRDYPHDHDKKGRC